MTRFVGFGLARIVKSEWIDCKEADKLISCPYVWTVYTKMGEVEESKGKIDKFWALLSIKDKSPLRVGIKKGPYGYVFRQNTFEWAAVPTKEEFDALLELWIKRKSENEAI